MTLQAQDVSVSERRGLAGGWLVAVVGGCVGLAIMGDSLMYSILPLAAPSLGIPLPLVGVLLSVNRLVRLFSNAGASRVFEQFGPRWPFVGSLALGAIATLLYGIATGFILFLVARMLWGISWSGLRHGGYQAVWTGEPSQKGRLTGLLWGLVRLGSAIGVLVGGVLYDRSGYNAAIYFVIAAAVVALPLGSSGGGLYICPHPRVALPKAMLTRRMAVGNRHGRGQYSVGWWWEASSSI
jgi:MFS family permease